MTAGSEQRVVVIGGGVIGLATAFVLIARSPRLSVTVLERSAAGEGASRYAGAMDIPYFRNDFQRDLVSTSWAWHETHAVHAGTYRRRAPMVWYACSDADLQTRITVPLEEPRADGGPAWLVPDDTRVLRSPSFVIDALAWCRALARELKQSGRCALIEQVEATSLECEPSGGIRANCADGRSYTADHAVLALGPWLPGWDERLRSWASSIGLRTKRVFGLNVDIDRATGEALGWPSADVYLHPAPGASSAAAYCLSLRHDEWDVDPDSPHAMADEVLVRAAAFLNQVVGAGGWRITGHRVFVDSYTQDFQAVIESCGALGADVTVVTGTHGSGVRMAPGIAEKVADHVFGRLAQNGQAS